MNEDSKVAPDNIEDEICDVYANDETHKKILEESPARRASQLSQKPLSITNEIDELTRG
jgi:ethanolamine utilization microcompartment shell protein EutL